jgi:hypothetical protein
MWAMVVPPLAFVRRFKETVTFPLLFFPLWNQAVS